jgi:MSHA pilin protein MshD
MSASEISVARQARQSGLSLIELVIAIVIVSIGLAALLIPIINATRQSADPLILKQTLAVAEALLEEIELKPFANPPGGFSGAATQANRPLFDDVSDYNGFATIGIFTLDGVAVPGLGGYNVTAVAVTNSALGAIPAANAKLILVTVTGSNGEAVTLAAYRTSYF